MTENQNSDHVLVIICKIMVEIRQIIFEKTLAQNLSKKNKKKLYENYKVFRCKRKTLIMMMMMMINLAGFIVCIDFYAF